MKRSLIIGIIVVVIIVIIAGVFLGMQKNDNAAVGDNPVSIANFAFSPSVINVHVGDTVTWKNNDGVTHTVSSDSNSTTAFDSGNLASGSTFTFTFTSVGDYWYHCNIHSTMHGMVHVVAVGALY